MSILAYYFQLLEQWTEYESLNYLRIMFEEDRMLHKRTEAQGSLACLIIAHTSVWLEKMW